MFGGCEYGDRRMDLRYTPEQDAFRAEARAWLEANVPAEPLPSFDTEEGFALHREWERTLSEGRWSAVSWPVEYGGRGADYIHWLIFEEEYYRAGAPGRVNQNGIFLLGPTIMEVGTDGAEGAVPADDGVERDRVGAGVERAQRRQRPRGDPLDRRLSATATSGCSTARRSGRRARCGPTGASASSAPTRRPSATAGLTFILVPLDTPGITVRPIAQLDGDTGFAEIFFDDVRVPVENTLGEVNQGWRVAMATAGFERGVSLRSPARFSAAADRLVAAVARRTPTRPTPRCATRSPTRGCRPRATGCTPT